MSRCRCSRWLSSPRNLSIKSQTVSPAPAPPATDNESIKPILGVSLCAASRTVESRCHCSSWLSRKHFRKNALPPPPPSHWHLQCRHEAACHMLRVPSCATSRTVESRCRACSKLSSPRYLSATSTITSPSAALTTTQRCLDEARHILPLEARLSGLWGGIRYICLLQLGIAMSGVGRGAVLLPSLGPHADIILIRLITKVLVVRSCEAHSNLVAHST